MPNTNSTPSLQSLVGTDVSVQFVGSGSSLTVRLVALEAAGIWVSNDLDVILDLDGDEKTAKLIEVRGVSFHPFASIVELSPARQ